MLDGKENTHGITTSEKKTYTVDEIAALLNISYEVGICFSQKRSISLYQSWQDD